MKIKRLNVYTCKKCNRITVTIDRDEGVTPFMIGCTIDECDGTSQSSFYNVNPSLIPTYEWFKPENEKEVKKLAIETINKSFSKFKKLSNYKDMCEGLVQGMLEHYRQGGLELRKIE